MARAEKPRSPDTFNVCSWFVFNDPDEERFNAEKSKSARMAIEDLFKSSAKPRGDKGSGA